MKKLVLPSAAALAALSLLGSAAAPAAPGRDGPAAAAVSAADGRDLIPKRRFSESMNQLPKRSEAPAEFRWHLYVYKPGIQIQRHRTYCHGPISPVRACCRLPLCDKAQKWKLRHQAGKTGCVRVNEKISSDRPLIAIN